MKVVFLFFTDPPRPFSSSVAALAPVVRAAGHQPFALEVSLRARISDVAAQVAALEPDVVAVSAMSRDWPGAHTLLLQVRALRSCWVVVGGYHASMAPQDVAQCAAVDALVVGEGERPLRALLDHLATVSPRSGDMHLPDPGISGLWWRRPDGWTAPLPKPDPEPQIAALPWWDYDVFGDTVAHLSKGINTFGPQVDRYLPVRASRGCPYACSYCSAPKWGAMHGMTAGGDGHVRPVEQLCAELASLRDRYQPEGFEFWDEHFPLHIGWLRAFAQRYPQLVGLPFKVEMHPSAATYERLALLKQAGCVLFHCGVEAGDEQLRRTTLNRRTKDADLQRVFDDARSLGLQTSASLMTMLPGETRAQAHSTVQLLRQVRPDSFMWSNYHPLPGTVLGEATVPAWPGPSRERFNDYNWVQPTLASLQTAAERDQTYVELTDLQTELVRAAGALDRARPLEIPQPPRAAPPHWALQLGLLPADAPLGETPRLNRVAREGDQLLLEIEALSLPPQQVVIAPRSQAGHFVATPHLQLSYKGRSAAAELLAAIRTLAARLQPLTWDELLRSLAA